MPALKCEDLNTWVRYAHDILMCPDCGAAVVDYATNNVKLHIDFHRGLNIWDPNYQEYRKEESRREAPPNYQEYRKRKDPEEEGGS